MLQWMGRLQDVLIFHNSREIITAPSLVTPPCVLSISEVVVSWMEVNISGTFSTLHAKFNILVQKYFSCCYGKRTGTCGFQLLLIMLLITVTEVEPNRLSDLSNSFIKSKQKILPALIFQETSASIQKYFQHFFPFSSILPLLYLFMLMCFSQHRHAHLKGLMDGFTLLSKTQMGAYAISGRGCGAHL